MFSSQIWGDFDRLFSFEEMGVSFSLTSYMRLTCKAFTKSAYLSLSWDSKYHMRSFLSITSLFQPAAWPTEENGL